MPRIFPSKRQWQGLALALAAAGSPAGAAAFVTPPLFYFGLVQPDHTQHVESTVLKILNAIGHDGVLGVATYAVPTNLDESFEIAYPHPVENRFVNIRFERYSVRSPNFKSFIRTADGALVEFDIGPVRTVRGIDTQTGEVVAVGMLADDGLQATVSIDGHTTELAPAKRILPSLEHLYTIQEPQPLTPEQLNKTCGNLDAEKADRQVVIEDLHPGDSAGARTDTSAGEHTVELACEADWYFTDAIGSLSGTASTIENTIVAVNSPYGSANIRYYISSIVINDGSDSYGGGGVDAPTLLNAFKGSASSIHGISPFDAALLFSNRVLSSGTVFGLAMCQCGSACCNRMCDLDSAGIPRYAYALITLITNSPSTSRMGTLAAHELGHLWGLDHADGFCEPGGAGSDDSTVMCIELAQRGFPWGYPFSEDSKDALRNAAANAFCIDQSPNSTCLADNEDEEDVNRNFIVDSCELATPMRYDATTPSMGPFDGVQAQSTLVFGLPMATSDVELQLSVRADVKGSNKTVSVSLNGQSLGVFFGNLTGSGCVVTSETVTIPMEVFNDALTEFSDGRDIFDFVATSSVTSCFSTIPSVPPNTPSSYVKMRLGYDTRHRDLDGDGVPDEHQIVTLDEPDCNGNRSLDEEEGQFGNDCNRNRVPDDCEIADSTAEDCNNNGLIDSCELAFTATSPRLTPPIDNQTASHTFTNLPLAAPGSVLIQVHAVANLNDADEFYKIYINDEFISDFYNYSITSCDTAVQSFAISSAEFNLASAGGGVEITLVPVGITQNGSCAGRFVEVKLHYPMELDLNGNGELDSCDISSGAADTNGNGIIDSYEDCDNDTIPNSLDGPDCDGNGIPDGCEIDGYVYVSPTHHFTPVDNDFSYTLVLPSVPLADSLVTLEFLARADLDTSTEEIDIYLGADASVMLDEAFDAAGANCSTDRTDTVTVSASDFNSAIGPDGSMTITLVPTTNVNQFDSNCFDKNDLYTNFVDVTVHYDTVGAENCNGDDVPDSCTGFCPDSTTVEVGTIRTGSTSDLCCSDNDRLEIWGSSVSDSSGVYSRLQLVSTGTSPISTGAESISFCFEARKPSSADVFYTIEMYDFSSSTYVSNPVDLMTGTVDDVYCFSINDGGVPGSLDQYLDNGSVQARITVESAPEPLPGGGGPTPVMILNVRFDEIRWLVE